MPNGCRAEERKPPAAIHANPFRRNTMSLTTVAQTPLQNALNLAGRVLLAVLFLPAGIGKLTGFAGTVGYISSAGLPLPSVGAALALTVEIVGSLALLAGWARAGPLWCWGCSPWPRASSFTRSGAWPLSRPM